MSPPEIVRNGKRLNNQWDPKLKTIFTEIQKISEIPQILQIPKFPKLSNLTFTKLWIFHRFGLSLLNYDRCVLTKKITVFGFIAILKLQFKITISILDENSIRPWSSFKGFTTAEWRIVGKSPKRTSRRRWRFMKNDFSGKKRWNGFYDLLMG